MAYKILHGLESIHLRDYHALTATDVCGSNALVVFHSLQRKSMHPSEHCLQCFLHAQIFFRFFSAMGTFLLWRKLNVARRYTERIGVCLIWEMV